MSRQADEVRVEVRGDLESVRKIQDEIEEALEAKGYAHQDIFAIRLRLEEAFLEAIKYDIQMDPARLVRIHYTIADDELKFEIRGSG